MEVINVALTVVPEPLFCHESRFLPVLLTIQSPVLSEIPDTHANTIISFVTAIHSTNFIIVSFYSTMRDNHVRVLAVRAPYVCYVL